MIKLKCNDDIAITCIQGLKNRRHNMNVEYKLNKKNAIIAYLYIGLKDVYAVLPDDQKFGI